MKYNSLIMAINPVGGPLGDGGGSGDPRLASLDLILIMLQANISIFGSVEDDVLAAADEISALIQGEPTNPEIEQKFKAILNMMLAEITKEYDNLSSSGDILQGDPNDSTIASITAKLQAINTAINADPTDETISSLMEDLISTLDGANFVLRSSKLDEFDSIFNSLNASLASDVRAMYLSSREQLLSATTIASAEELINALSNYSNIYRTSQSIEGEKAQQAHIGGVLMKLKMSQTTNQFLEIASENEAYKRLEEDSEENDALKRIRQEGLIANMNPTTEEYYKELEENAEKIKKERKLEQQQ